MRLEKLDLALAWATMLTGMAHALSVFYFFRPLVHPEAVGLARGSALWWVSGGEALVFGGLVNQPPSQLAQLAQLAQLTHLVRRRDSREQHCLSFG